jgi:hypothetical protein
VKIPPRSPPAKPRVAYCTSSERFVARWCSCRSDGVVSASLVAGWRVGSRAGCRGQKSRSPGPLGAAGHSRHHRPAGFRAHRHGHGDPNFTSLAGALAQTAATANGRSRQRNEGGAAPKISRRGLALTGELPGTLRRSSKQAQQTFTRALTTAVQAYGKETRRTAPRTPSSSGRSRNAATTGYPSRPLRPGASARVN